MTKSRGPRVKSGSLRRFPFVGRFGDTIAVESVAMANLEANFSADWQARGRFERSVADLFPYHTADKIDAVPESLLPSLFCSVIDVPNRFDK